MKHLWIGLCVAALMGLSVMSASAQQMITYGASLVSSLSPDAPVQVYSFSGGADVHLRPDAR